MPNTADVTMPRASRDPGPGVEGSYPDTTLPVIAELLDLLEAEGVRYCQWKSNFFLAEALTGKGDLDLLIDRKDGDRFLALLAGLGFREAADTLKPPMPGVCH